MKKTEFIYGRHSDSKFKYVLENLNDTLKSGKDAVILVPDQQEVYWTNVCVAAIDSKFANNYEVCSFKRLADNVFREFGGVSRKFITDSEKYLLMWNAIVAVSDKLKIYGTKDREDRYTPVFLDAIKEVKQFSVTPDLLKETAQNIEGGSILADKLNDLSLVFSTYNELLGSKYNDPDDMFDHLCNKLANNDYFNNKDVYITSFLTLTPKELMICQYIFNQADDIYVTFASRLKAPNEVVQGDQFLLDYKRELSSKAFQSNREITNINIPDSRNEELKYITERLWDFNSRDLFHAETDNITLISCNDRYDEALLVSKRIKQLVNKGSKLSEIAIVSANLESMIGITDSELEKEGIPVYTSIRRLLSKEPAFKFILHAISVVSTGWKKDTIIAFSKTGLCNLTADEADAFEKYVNIWNISRKDRFCVDSWDMNPKGFSKMSEYDKWSQKFLELANSAREKIIPYLEDFSNDFHGNVKSKCKAIFNLLSSFNVYGKLRDESNALNSIGDYSEAQNTAHVWKSICEVLDTLCKISGDSIMDAKRMTAMLLQCANSCSIGTIPDGIEKVLLGSVNLMRLDGYKHIIILGAVMGEFPNVPKDNGYFSEEDKIKLETLGINLEDKIANKTEEALFRFAYTAGAPEETLTVMIPSVNKESQPSMGTRALNRMFPKCAKYDFTGINGSKTIRSLVSTDATFNLPLSADNENIDSDLASSLYEKAFRLSQSKIETFQDCPFKYYSQYVLNLDEDREAKVAESDTGTFVHYILEKYMEEAATKHEFPLSDEKINEICEKFASKFIEENCPSNMSERSRRNFDRVIKNTKIFAKNLSNEFAQSDFIPFGFETELGFNNEYAPSLDIPLSNDRKILTNGIVDRVDIMRSGNDVFVRVVDYKTGKKQFKLKDALEGRNFQMLLYLYSLTSLPECELKTLIAPNGETIKEAGVLYFSAVPGRVEKNKDYTEDDGINRTMSEINRNGILLDNINVLRSMDKELSGKYIPVTEKDGMLKASADILQGPEDFKTIKESLFETLASVGEKILSGHSCSTPDSGHNPCKYCRFRPICRHEIGRDDSNEVEGDEDNE